MLSLLTDKYYYQKMSKPNKPINQMDHSELLQWVDKLPTDKFTTSNKQKIKTGMKDFGDASGSDVFDADADDLADSFGISNMLAKRLFQAIGDYKQNSFQSVFVHYNSNSVAQVQEPQEREFSLNLQGHKGSYVTLDKMKASYSVKYVKEEYLRYYGQDLNNEKKRKGLNLRLLGTRLDDENKALGDYGIYDGNVTISVIFRVNGGMAYQPSGDDNKEQKKKEEIVIENRVRKLRHKKYQNIKLSKKPDCIMGYTDKDGIKRAEMPCGCAIASDTMYRYMVAAFDQDDNFRAVTMICPMPKNQCKGSDDQRKWAWSLVFVVADLTNQEKNKYSDIIDRRIAGNKACPHCKANCERPKDLKIFRVRCVQCNERDWCWECGRTWLGGGLTVCGNSNCIKERLNKILKSAKMINPKWSEDVKVPDIRHCPQCFTIIEYQEKCAHMTCVGCPHEFCFKCLKKWEKGNTNWFTHCKEPAAIQQIK